jgi:hypothetical protein
MGERYTVPVERERDIEDSVSEDAPVHGNEQE